MDDEMDMDLSDDEEKIHNDEDLDN